MRRHYILGIAMLLTGCQRAVHVTLCNDSSQPVSYDARLLMAEPQDFHGVLAPGRRVVLKATPRGDGHYQLTLRNGVQTKTREAGYYGTEGIDDELAIQEDLSLNDTCQSRKATQ